MSTICQQGNEVCPCEQLTAHSQNICTEIIAPMSEASVTSFSSCLSVILQRTQGVTEIIFFRSRHTLMKQLFHIQNVAPTFPPFPKLLPPKLASQQKRISPHRDKLQTRWIFLLFHSRSASVLRHWLIFFQQSITKPW